VVARDVSRRPDRVEDLQVAVGNESEGPTTLPRMNWCHTYDRRCRRGGASYWALRNPV